MPQFAYEAVDRTGGVMRGLIDAAGRVDAVDRLVADGLTPTSVLERTSIRSLSLWRGRFGGGRRDTLVSLVGELSTLLKAGLSAERALAVLQGLAHRRALASDLAAMSDRLRSGSTFSDAFARTMPNAPAYIPHLIAAGEASGHLPDVMARLATNLARVKSLRDRLISGLTYPALLLATMLAVLYVIFTVVLPRLKPMFLSAGDALPTSTAILMSVGEFMTAYGWLVLLASALLIAAFVRALRQPAFRMAVDRKLVSPRFAFAIPLEYEAARFCRNLQILLSGGLPLDRALAVATKTVHNTWLGERLAAVHDAVVEGRRLKIALADTRAFPPIVAEFAAVGEETGQLAQMMDEVATVLDQDVEKRLDRFVTFAMPAATLVMGLLVASIMIGIVSGILAVNELAL